MGYFSNGTEGGDYQDEYCSRCLHDNPDKGIYCPIWNLHLRDNYKECNNKESYLHVLIPRERGKHYVGNARCTMFVNRGLLSNLQIEKHEHETLKASEQPPADCGGATK